MNWERNSCFGRRMGIGYRLALLLFSSILFQNRSGQKLEEESREVLKQLIEERIEFLSDDQIQAEADYSNLFQNLEYHYHHPLSLNHADLDELRELGLLNEIQIRELIAHREKNGKLIAMEELQSIPSFDLKSILMIRPFCTINESSLQSLP